MTRLTVAKTVKWQGEEIPGFKRIAVGKDELGHEHYNLVLHTLDGDRYIAEGDRIVVSVEIEYED